MSFDIAQRLRERTQVTSCGCWQWTGKLTADGYAYGRMNARRGMIHRLVWELLVGPIAAGLQLDHLCRNRACCNPDHLEPVTQRENILRGISAPARRARQTHCSRGHELTGDNVLVEKNGTRRCRPCRRMGETRRRRAA